MAKELATRGLESFTDYVREITVGRGEEARVLGMVNIVSGTYTPPDLLSKVAAYGEQSRTVQEVIARAEHPLNSHQFKNVSHRVEFNPNSSLITDFADPKG